MDPYILTFRLPEEIVEEFKKIGVDAGGIEIMRRKGFLRCVKIRRVRNFSANILKQEMLSLGGDVALSRGTLTGQVKYTDCLVLGNTSQILQLTEKLKIQPFGLAQLGAKIRYSLGNFEKSGIVLDVAGKKIRMGRRTLVMGIINASHDSFSGDSVIGMGPDEIKALARGMVESGADMLDIGGESTRPGSSKISAKDELRRVMPVLKLLRKSVRVPLSIDTTKSVVARAALDLGVNIINDVSAMRFDKKMASIVARYKASLVLMHMKGTPAKMQDSPVYDDVVGEVISFLADAVKRAEDAGVDADKIIVDPGIGFGKGPGHNLEILGRLSALKSLGRPIMVGVSRKRFIGRILNAEVKERAWGTAAAVCMSIANGAGIVRVHDVNEMAQAAKVADAIVNRGTAYGR
ncbi:MAG TPA: dihydropteroate synthase [Candidatus Omnitrophica bacterium]|nr:dihydropteroate synthase [Candidatus Omnitrophota bacterium]